ncbi:hypothetical protein CVT26_006458 [Gymnopilus dilepis]|uniref:Uncharacterized protein n=1 Tax=Gymnopilus dilepis TaxID=231916 RepID=A0A409YTX8_9AGAR|nr:hypothetical protein CVT26_006458 [Gymnopilus dilepis]
MLPPENTLGKLVVRDIIPAISKLQKSCCLSFGTFFHQALLYENLTLPETEVAEFVRSDEFFDRVTFNAFTKPRNWKLWAPCWNGNDPALPANPFNTVNRTILSLPVLTVQIPSISPATEDGDIDSPLTPLSSSDGYESEGREHTPSPAPTLEPPAPSTTPVTVIETNYDPDLEENKKEDFTSEGVKDFGAYIKVSNDCGRGARLRVNDVNGDVIFLVYRDLPDDLRERLYDILKAIFTTKLEYADSEAAGEFLAQLAMHLGNWNKYPTHGDGYPDDQEPAASLKNKKKTSSCLPRSTHDTQRLSEIYRLLKQCLKEIFEWMKIAFKQTFPDDFEVICEFSKNLPGDEASPVYPFSGLVVNLNVSTRIHRDFQDLRLCLVMPIMDPSCTGGDLCFKEPGIRLQMRCGDMVAFPSNRISHYNTHFKGERASLVFHTDSNGQAWVNSFNKWGDNNLNSLSSMPETRSTNSRKNTASTTKATAKKKSTGKAPSSEIIPSDISAVAMETYRQVLAKIEAKKRAAKAAEDAAIRERNRELLDADGQDSDTERANPPHKKKKTNANVLELSSDEEELASGLRSIQAQAAPQAGQRSQEEEEDTIEDRGSDDDGQEALQHESDIEEGLQAELQDVDVDDVDVNMDSPVSGDGELSNEINVRLTPEPGHTMVHNHSKSKGQRAKAGHSSSVNMSSNTSKVVEKNFTPRTLRLAIASKSHVRTRTVYEEPFPRNNKIARINFAWKTVKESAIASNDNDIIQAYKRAVKNTAVKSQLMKFTLYGRTGLISSIISKARDKVRSFYGLAGDPDAVKKDVEWLLKDSHFLYGGINLKERTVDQMQPFGCQLIVDIIEAQWFPSTSRSKLDLETTNRIYERKDLPLNVLLLSVTAIEHGLKEWSSNGRKACQITFSEDTAKQSYERHLGHWKYFEEQMKAWPAWFKRKTLAQILANHSNFDIDAKDNDFAGLDFAALDSLAGYEGQGSLAEEGQTGVQVQVDSLRSNADNGHGSAHSSEGPTDMENTTSA